MAPRAASEEETQARAELDFSLPWTAARQHLTGGTVRFPGVKTHLTLLSQRTKKEEKKRGHEGARTPTHPNRVLPGIPGRVFP